MILKYALKSFSIGTLGVGVNLEFNTIDSLLLPNHPLLTQLETVPFLPLHTCAFQQLEAYFRGDGVSFDLPLRVSGPLFDKRVWSSMMNIPYGTKLSYSELARNIGSPKAYRAVGSACGRNPLPIFIPCHRVVLKGGACGYYGGGASLKVKLLELEAHHSRRIGCS